MLHMIQCYTNVKLGQSVSLQFDGFFFKQEEPPIVSEASKLAREGIGFKTGRRPPGKMNYNKLELNLVILIYKIQY